MKSYYKTAVMVVIIFFVIFIHSAKAEMETIATLKDRQGQIFGDKQE